MKIIILEQSLKILATVLPSGTIDLMKMNGKIKEQAQAPFLLHKHKSATLNAAAAAPPPPPRRHRRLCQLERVFSQTRARRQIELGRGGRLFSVAATEYAWGAAAETARAWRRRQNRLVRGGQSLLLRGGQKKLGRGGRISLSHRRHDGTCPFPSELLKFEHEPPSSLFSCTRENQWADRTAAERAHASNSQARLRLASLELCSYRTDC